MKKLKKNLNKEQKLHHVNNIPYLTILYSCVFFSFLFSQMPVKFINIPAAEAKELRWLLSGVLSW